MENLFNYKDDLVNNYSMKYGEYERFNSKNSKKVYECIKRWN